MFRKILHPSTVLVLLLSLSCMAYGATTCNNILGPFSSEALLSTLQTEVSDSNRGDLIELELTQDATHIVETLPSFVPDRLLLFVGKRALKKKMRKILGLPSHDPKQPEIIDMELRQHEVQFSGGLSSSQMILRLRTRREYLVPILLDYVQSLNHPALGEKVIRMDVLQSPE